MADQASDLTFVDLTPEQLDAMRDAYIDKVGGPPLPVLGCSAETRVPSQDLTLVARAIFSGHSL